jgi:hypothetical protein
MKHKWPFTTRDSESHCENDLNNYPSSEAVAHDVIDARMHAIPTSRVQHARDVTVNYDIENSKACKHIHV